jgi:hypothetical protein
MPRPSFLQPSPEGAAAAKAADRPPIPPANTIEKLAYLPRSIPQGMWACRAVKDLPWAGLRKNDLFLAVEAYGAYLVDRGEAARTYPDVHVATQFQGGVRVGNRVVQRGEVVRVSYDDAVAALARIDRLPPDNKYAGALQLVPEDQVAAFEWGAVPPDPRPGFPTATRGWESSPEIRVRANMTMTQPAFLDWFPIMDQQERVVCEWAAVVGSRLKNRHGEPVLVILGELSPEGKAFAAALDQHIAKRNGVWSTGDSDFPLFYPRHAA